MSLKTLVSRLRRPGSLKPNITRGWTPFLSGRLQDDAGRLASSSAKSLIGLQVKTYGLIFEEVVVVHLSVEFLKGHHK